MIEKRFCTLILAAGKGTRMKSDLAKVLHVLNGKPLLHYSIEAAKKAGAEKIVAVIGHQADIVRKVFAGSGCVFVEQNPQLGTGHAVLQAKDVLADYKGLTVILCGDVPLLKASTIKSLIDNHLANSAVVSVLTTVPPPPHAYGRIVKDDKGNVLKIVEHKDATEEEKKIGEINTGIYCVDTKFLFEALGKVTNHNQQGEYYLTDIVEIAVREGKKVKSFIADDYVEVMGINTVEELSRAEKHLLA
ncbi:MAG TPA: sugar phosphate nucleotidyltransferase [Smithella sp.]|nr:sugar phosphate nucleotidyltransferase [Smithella sp.]HNY49375.1 sugar phosphate nucleotidyltransferase [Smithella sp.]HOG89434.1 sugar phosphate nucleotidyltransferase [Smithella sp.]HOU50203.1 sugar phosphate nucleotidyltransferase [Smithella sp.]HQG64315.1 sugar phosphate nucleotidyltransferase [Smithella sp.]